MNKNKKTEDVMKAAERFMISPDELKDIKILIDEYDVRKFKYKNKDGDLVLSKAGNLRAPLVDDRSVGYAKLGENLYCLAGFRSPGGNFAISLMLLSGGGKSAASWKRLGGSLLENEDLVRKVVVKLVKV